jgi:4a-hydroxytetrahydrobiopterin dehydratase
MPALHTLRCIPCKTQASLSPEIIEPLRLQLHPAWALDKSEPPCIKRLFRFKHFWETMGFVNAVAWIAHQENHHPDVYVRFNTCEVRFTTHACKGLSENDFICAAKVDRLFPIEATRG